MRLYSRLAIGILLVAAACGGAPTSDLPTSTLASTTTTQTSSTTTSTTTTTEPRPTTTVDRGYETVEVGGSHLAYECRGSGTPVVILDNGLGGGDTYDPAWGGYGATLSAISEFTTVCVYGRGGAWGSDPRSESVTVFDQVAELAGLIQALGLETPLVHVGWSWGGIIGQTLAATRPELVAGLVLVDSSHPDQDERLSQPYPADYGQPEYVLLASSFSELEVADLGSLPIYVLTAGSAWLGTSPEDIEAWGELQHELASMSTDSQHLTLEGVSHLGMLRAFSEITAAVLDVISRIES